MTASTHGWSTCSTSRLRASGRSTCASDSAASTRCCTWWAAGAGASLSPRRRCRTTSGSTTSWSGPSSTRRRAFHDALTQSDHGRFVLVSSSQAQSPTATNASYAAAKAAAESWTLALAESFKESAATANIVVVNAILTPRMREQNPDKEYRTFTSAEQIAEAIAFVCSDAAAKMNGKRLSLHP